MTSAIVLQARMTSTRLPGKVLEVVAGRTVLEWVVRASARIPGIDRICVAVPEEPENDPVAAEANRLGATTVRGSNTDVLDRFRVSSETLGASVIMRVTTDCPMMDPSICGEVLALWKAQNVDYACNNEPFSFPHGLDCEVFSSEVLGRAAAKATAPYDREHVTPWMKRESSVSRAYLRGPQDDRIHWRWTVDHPQDLEFFRAIAEALGDDVSNWHRVSEYLRENTALHEINMMCRQR